MTHPDRPGRPDTPRHDQPGDLYDRAPCGYLSTTPDGRIVMVNQTLVEWTGYQRAELLERRFVDLLAPGGRLYHETHYAPMLRLQGQVRELALEIVRADGRRVPVLVNANLEVDEAGTPAAIRVAMLEATERREYERELLRAKQRAEESERQSRELANTLQQTLLPPSEPGIPGLDVAAAFRPASLGVDIGGDFYDVFQVGEGDWVAVIGDICGKGVQAAILTALVRHTLRAVVVGLHAPSQALSALNEVLLQHDTDRFCTAVMVRLQHGPEGWRATIGTGGHPRPFLLGPRDGRRDGRRDGPVQVGGAGPLLGIYDEPVFRDEQLALAPGGTLVLYTDGITESRGRDDYYGEARLQDSLVRWEGPAKQVVTGVVDDVVAFSDGPPRDDVAVLVLRVPD